MRHLTLILLLTSNFAFSQSASSFKAGVDISNVQFKNVSTGEVSDATIPRKSFHFGMSLEQMLGNLVSIYGALELNPAGYRLVNPANNTIVEVANMTYINLPLMAKFNFKTGDIRLYAGVGGYYGYGLSLPIINDYIDWGYNFRRGDLGFSSMVGVEYSDIFLEFSHKLGIRNTQTSNNLNYLSSKNRIMTICLGVRFRE